MKPFVLFGIFDNGLYARDTSKKIRAVQRAKGERGERVSTAIPYGYMKDPAKAFIEAEIEKSA